MIWIAPSEEDALTDALEKRLWDAADQSRANSGLMSQAYSAPVLGLIFLRFADVRLPRDRSRGARQPSPRPARGHRVVRVGAAGKLITSPLMLRRYGV